MNWKQAFSSAIGRKFIMAGTGLCLILFLLIHCYANFMIFLPDGEEKFNTVAHFLGTNLVIHILEVGLFLFFIIHIVQGIRVEFYNKARRPIKYAVATGDKASKWYSRYMFSMGMIIFIFLILHLANFWAQNRWSQAFGAGEHNLYYDMQTVFQHGIIIIVYVIGCIALAWHLVHGFWSAFHSLGMSPIKYKYIIRGIGYAFAIIIPLAFIAMPLAFYYNLLPAAQLPPILP